jgi:hypothetical protein
MAKKRKKKKKAGNGKGKGKGKGMQRHAFPISSFLRPSDPIQPL